MKLFLKLLLFAVFEAVFFQTSAQDKLSLLTKKEKEEQIRAEVFPALALLFLQKNYPGVKKIKYFREKTTDSVFYEAKFRFQQKKNSVKFFENGKFYDAEVEIKKIDLEKEKTTFLETALRKLFFKFKIVKIQLQFLENQNFIGFEIEVKGFTEQDEGFFEINLDKFGNVYKTRKIEQNHPFSVYW